MKKVIDYAVFYDYDKFEKLYDNKYQILGYNLFAPIGKERIEFYKYSKFLSFEKNLFYTTKRPEEYIYIILKDKVPILSNDIFKAVL